MGHAPARNANMFEERKGMDNQNNNSSMLDDGNNYHHF
jgi:hypothetical protein